MTALLDHLDHDDCLVFGIGNVGRSDDGLGWAFVDWIENARELSAGAERWRRMQVLRRYQLALEDADLLSRVRRVLFVDSTKDPQVDSYAVTRPVPRFDVSFSSHALSVPALLATCRTCFGHVPETHVMAIRGYAWDLAVGLSRPAADNLAAALRCAGGGSLATETAESTDPLGSPSHWRAS